MTWGYMYIFIFIGTHFLVIMGIYLFCKYKAALMEQMMITMTLSMSFGLVIGVLMGIIYHDNLLLSILMSMGISGLAGANLGLRLHGLAGIEGFFYCHYGRHDGVHACRDAFHEGDNHYIFSELISFNRHIHVQCPAYFVPVL